MATGLNNLAELLSATNRLAEAEPKWGCSGALLDRSRICSKVPLTPGFFFSGVLSAGGSQLVLEFFRLFRLCRYPGAACELCISEIERLKTHNCRITRNIDYHVTRFGDHPLSILARAFHAHGFIGSEQGTRTGQGRIERRRQHLH